MKFQVRYLALLCLSSVIDGFEYFWMGSLHKNIQLLQEPLKALFLSQHISYYALTTFQMMLPVILLMIPMLMILLFCCKFDQASDLWQQAELVSELESDLQDTVDWDMKWFICFNA